LTHAMQTTHHLEAAELVKIVLAQRQARFYRVEISAFRPTSGSAEIGAASGVLASGSERPLSEDGYIGAGKSGMTHFHPTRPAPKAAGKVS
jgi:hypothetical protein